jgi:hypothetical protein
MPWFRDRDAAILGSDLALDRMPSGVEGVRMPVHLITIVAMGTPILDNCDLEPLAAAAAERQRWTFMLTVGPLTVPGGTGSPVNPIASSDEKFATERSEGSRAFSTPPDSFQVLHRNRSAAGGW